MSTSDTVNATMSTVSGELTGHLLGRCRSAVQAHPAAATSIPAAPPPSMGRLGCHPGPPPPPAAQPNRPAPQPSSRARRRCGPRPGAGVEGLGPQADGRPSVPRPGVPYDRAGMRGGPPGNAVACRCLPGRLVGEGHPW
jgi:hypothetical protein